MLDAEGYPPAFVDAGPWRIEFSGSAPEADGVRATARIVLRDAAAKGAP
jgi:hypothetical protein